MAKICLEYGVDIVNDVSGGIYDPEILNTVAKYDCSYVCMHSRGTPITMDQLTNYNNLVEDIINELNIQLDRCRQAGINE